MEMEVSSLLSSDSAVIASHAYFAVIPSVHTQMEAGDESLSFIISYPLFLSARHHHHYRDCRHPFNKQVEFNVNLPDEKSGTFYFTWLRETNWHEGEKRDEEENREKVR